MEILMTDGSERHILDLPADLIIHEGKFNDSWMKDKSLNSSQDINLFLKCLESVTVALISDSASLLRRDGVFITSAHRPDRR